MVDKDAAANLAVKDLQVARHFYRDTLGLKEVGSEGDELVVFQSGKTDDERLPLRVRRHQQGHRGDLGRGRRHRGRGGETLKAKGVAFEHYDMPGLTLKGDIHDGGGMKVAWFKDPDGNILNLIGN